MYDLAAQLSKDSNDLLWYSILGMTDQHVQERVDAGNYALQLLASHEQVEKHNQPDDENDDENNPPANREETDSLVHVARRGAISYANEFRFMLLRHWTLYDSMYHSQYVATRLGIWTEQGRTKLKKFLTMMGLPLKDCKQNYCFMGDTHKQMLEQKVEEFKHRFNLNDIKFGSFYKQHGSNFEISAADMVYALSALLEQGPDPTDDDADVDDDDEQLWERNFYRAYDALASDNVVLLREGIDRSIKLQKAIVEQGIGMIKKKVLISSGPFRYAVLEESPHLDMFNKPLGLQKLALFLVDSLLETIRKSVKPFVISAYCEKKGTYLVVGVPAPGSSSMGTRKNTFGGAFRKAAETTGARIKHDGFESSIMEVQKDDLKDFMEYLHSGLITI